jgi:hypothetical protein
MYTHVGVCMKGPMYVGILRSTYFCEVHYRLNNYQSQYIDY